MIYHFSASVMKTKCQEVTLDQAKLLVPGFVAAWKIYYTAVGIAAPQIGAAARVFFFDPDRNTRKRRYGKPMLVVNPVLLSKSEEQNEMVEGCLSCPRKVALVTRPTFITMEFTDELGARKIKAFDGFAARVVQHELEHLEGLSITRFITY